MLDLYKLLIVIFTKLNWKMTLRVEDHISITSTDNTYTNYGFITRISDETIEVNLEMN